MLLGITLAIQDKIEREYERGVYDGMHALNTRQVDNLCAKWWFESPFPSSECGDSGLGCERDQCTSLDDLSDYVDEYCCHRSVPGPNK